MEKQLPKGRKFAELSFNEMNELWDQVKLAEQTHQAEGGCP